MSFNITRLFLPPYTFQKLVVYVGFSVLIISIFLVTMAMYSFRKKTVFPPQIAQCPDFFKIIGKNKCENVKKIGTCTEEVYDFDTPLFKGLNGNRKKYEKAMECGWVWDGITNNTELKGVSHS